MPQQALLHCCCAACILAGPPSPCWHTAGSKRLPFPRSPSLLRQPPHGSSTLFSTPAASAPPLPALQVSNGSSARLSTCVLLPHTLGTPAGRAHSAALAGWLAGASAVVLPVGSGSSPAPLQQLLAAAPRDVRLPVLLVAPDPEVRGMVMRSLLVLGRFLVAGRLLL